MHRSSWLAAGIMTVLLALCSCGHAHVAGTGAPAGDDISIRELSAGVWLVTTLSPEDRSLPANGLLVRTSAGLVLIDTPWNDEQTAWLLAWIRATLHQPLARVLVTHAHVDRMGGIREMQRNGITVCATPLTVAHVDTSQFSRPQPCLGLDTALTIGNRRLEVYFPGAGHTADNIVVWLPQEKILFGGCFVKADSAKNLGYIAEADLASWPASIARTQARYHDAVLVVPGHGDVGGPGLLAHTAQLLKEHEQDKRAPER